jgi:hypothetical protein
MKNLLYLFIILVLATACKKKSMVVIQAQNYLDNTNGSGYAGMTYGIVENWTPVFDLKSKSVAQGVLDANGHAAFELKMKPNRKYYLGIQKPDNVYYSEITLQESLDYEKNNTFNFEYAEVAYSKLILNNSNCFNANDKLVLYRSDDLENIDNNTPWQHNGCVYWETTGGVDGGPLGYSTMVYGNIYYKWEVTKNNITNTFYDTVYYPAGEYKTYQIDY